MAQSAMLVRLESGLKSWERALLADVVYEHISAIGQWPLWLAEMMLLPKLGYHERWNLTIFLLVNAVPPVIIAQWYIARGMLRDQSARIHIITILRDHKSGKLARFKAISLLATARDGSELRNWNDKKVSIACTFDPEEHPYYWDEPISMLSTNSLVAAGAAAFAPPPPPPPPQLATDMYGNVV